MPDNVIGPGGSTSWFFLDSIPPTRARLELLPIAVSNIMPTEMEQNFGQLENEKTPSVENYVGNTLHGPATQNPSKK